jgi:hypothetical protein
MFFSTFHNRLFVDEDAAIARALKSAKRIDPCHTWTYYMTYYPSAECMIVELWGEPIK